MQNDFSIVILAAGPNKRFKSSNPKILARIKNGETILQRQIRILHDTFPSVKITVVLGFQSEKILPGLPRFVSVIHTEFENLNDLNSLRAALKILSGALLIVYGDLIFPQNYFKGWKPKSSNLWIDRNNNVKIDSVGITENKNEATYLSYGIDNKWSQILFLTEPERNIFLDEATKPGRIKFCCYEILNEVIDKGGKFELVAPQAWIFEIDTNRDMTKVNRNENFIFF